MGKEIALICGDGGVRGGFIAGVVTGLLNRFPVEMGRVSTVVATSASAGSMCYYVSHGEKHPGREIWTRELSSSLFINYHGFLSFIRSHPIYDVDFLVRGIFEKKYPLDIERIRSSDVGIYISAQNYRTKNIEFFSNRPEGGFNRRNGLFVKINNINDVDLYDVIKAASAAPFVYDKLVPISGKFYMDAAALEPYTLDIPETIGKKRIVIVTKSNYGMSKSMYYWFAGKFWPIFINPFRHEHFDKISYDQYARKPHILKKLKRACAILCEYDDLLFLYPDERLGSNLDNSTSTLDRNFLIGERLVERKKSEISDFLSR